MNHAYAPCGVRVRAEPAAPPATDLPGAPGADAHPLPQQVQAGDGVPDWRGVVQALEQEGPGERAVDPDRCRNHVLMAPSQATAASHQGPALPCHVQSAEDALLDMREYDVPHHMRYAIDADVRCGTWYSVSAQVRGSKGGRLEEERVDTWDR